MNKTNHENQARGHLASVLDPLGIVSPPDTVGQDGTRRRANENVLRQHYGFKFGNLFIFPVFVFFF